MSSLVDLGRDPEAALRRLRRRLPVRPDPHALLGTAFHDWVQRFYGAERLFDLDDLPGAVDGQLARDGRRGARRTAGRVHGLAVGRPHTRRRRGALRHGHRRHGGAGPHRRGVRRRRRRRRSSTGRRAIRRTPRRPSGTPPFSSPSTGWRGRRCAACPPSPCGRRSTTCGPGRPSCPSRCRTPTNWRRCWSYPPPRSCGRS